VVGILVALAACRNWPRKKKSELDQVGPDARGKKKKKVGVEMLDTHDVFLTWRRTEGGGEGGKKRDACVRRTRGGEKKKRKATTLSGWCAYSYIAKMENPRLEEKGKGRKKEKRVR